MAILNAITVGNQLIIISDTDPSTGGGISAPVGSLILMDDGSGSYIKSNTSDTDWKKSITLDNLSAISAVGTITSGTWNGTAISAAYGGTGQTTYNIGDTLYASTSNTLSKLPIGSTGQVLTVVGGVPAWSSAAAGTVTAVSVVSANGFAGTVANASSTPAITLTTTITGLLKGNGTSISAATDADVTGKLLTGLNIIGSSITPTDSILSAFGKVQNQINGLLGGAIYQGVWNATTNIPALTSGIGTKGYYYVVNVAGNTNLDGITDWKVGDWAIFNGTTWDKVDNTDAVSSVNGFIGAVNLTTTDIPEGTQLYYNNARGIGSVLTGYISGAGVITAADTILSAIQKLNGNITAIPSYTFSTGLTNTANTITNNLSTGIAGGQSINGGTGASEILTISSTTSVTKGRIQIGSTDLINIGNSTSLNQRLLRIGQDTAIIDIGSLVGTTTQGALYLTKATPSATNYSLSSDSSGNTYVNAENGFTIQLRTNNVTRANIGGTFMNFTSGAAATAALVPYTFTTPASTNQTASTETIGFRVNMSASIQHATGAITTQRDFVIDARTHTAVAASTITTAATLAISAAPIAGTSVTITDSYALWLQSGGILISSGLMAVTATSTLASGGSFSTSNSTLTGATSQNASGSSFLHTGAGFNTSIYYGLSIQNRSSGALAAGMGAGLLFGLGYGGGSFINTKITSYAIGAVSSTLDSAFGIQTSIGGVVAERFTFYKESFGINTTTPNSYLNVNGSVSLAYITKTASYTLTASDYTVDCTANSFNITLPTAVGCTGRIYNIKNSGSGTITILTTSGQTVDGQLSGFWQLISSGTIYPSITVQSTGTNWIII